MKKLLVITTLSLLLFASTNGMAQREPKLFNRLSIGVGASTMGIGIDAATTLSRHFMLRAGVDIMPGIAFNGDVDVDVSGVSYQSTVNLKGDMGRTQGNVLLNIYPFKKSSFFITAGAFFGGNKLVSVTGHSQELQDLYNEYGDMAGIIIGDYKLPIDKNGNVGGGIEVSNFRPYVGLGFGRIVSDKSFSVMLEMGVQFHNTPKVYTDNGDLNTLLSTTDVDDEYTKIMDKLTVYPVIKLRICKKIF